MDKVVVEEMDSQNGDRRKEGLIDEKVGGTESGKTIERTKWLSKQRTPKVEIDGRKA